MKIVKICTALLAVLGLWAFPTTKAQGQNGGKMTQNFINKILKTHNDFRRAEGATNMKQLRWSKALQNDAQAWADKCRYMHAYGKWGENLFKAESPLPDDVLIERALSEWYYEKMSWKFTPDCNEACHYTQVVWSESEEIGCAFKRCPTLFMREEFILSGWMLVCYYSPQGNIIGKMPYTPGKACQACDPGYRCDRALCAKDIPIKPYKPVPRTKPPVFSASSHLKNPPPRSIPQHHTPPRNHHPPLNHNQAPVHHQPPPPAARHQPAKPGHHQQPLYQPNQPRQHRPPQHNQPHHRPQAPQVFNQTSIHARQPTFRPRYHQPQPQQHSFVNPHRQQQQPHQPIASRTKQTGAKSQVQYFSGKILSGWVPALSTEQPNVPDNTSSNVQYQVKDDPQANTQPQQSPINPDPSRIRTEPLRVYQQPQSQQPNTQTHNPAQPSQYNPPERPQTHHQQPMQHQSPSNNQQHQQHYQQQNQPTIHQQPAQNPYQSANPGGHQFPVQAPYQHTQSGSHQQQNPYQAVQASSHQQPAQVPYQQQPSHGGSQPHVYQHQQQPYYHPNTSYIEQAPYHHHQPNTVPGHYPNQYPGQAPQHASTFVDPRPIFVPPAKSPPTTTIPPPPPPTCVDEDKHCQHWGVYCKSNPYVHSNCRMTCNTCDIPSPPQVQSQSFYTAAPPTTTAEAAIVPSHPPSPQVPDPKQTRPPAPQYQTTTPGYYPQTTGYNPHKAPTTQGTSVTAAGHGFTGFCTDFDNRCKQWAKYCGFDEYVDEMCRLTCIRCK